MAKNDEEDFDSDNFEDDDTLEFEETPKKVKKEETRGRPRKEEPEEIEDEETPRKPVQKQKEITGERYKPFHLPERAGIIDETSGKSIGEDTLTILSVILNKVQKIEDATVG